MHILPLRHYLYCKQSSSSHGTNLWYTCGVVDKVVEPSRSIGALAKNEYLPAFHQRHTYKHINFDSLDGAELFGNLLSKLKLLWPNKKILGLKHNRKSATQKHTELNPSHTPDDFSWWCSSFSLYPGLTVAITHQKSKHKCETRPVVLIPEARLTPWKAMPYSGTLGMQIAKTCRRKSHSQSQEATTANTHHHAECHGQQDQLQIA